MPISGAFTGAAGACTSLNVSVTSRELPAAGAEPDGVPVASMDQPTGADVDLG
jgi:hypothetical protein